MAFRFASTLTFLLLLTTYVSLASAANSTAIPRAKHGCKDSCGDAIVPYPFGIGPNCSFDSWFEVTCSEASTPPTILLKGINMEVLNFSYDRSGFLDLLVIVQAGEPTTSKRWI
ncbi:hypothetical protein GQ457_04G026120 [Hibiscus cannabinus]